MFAECLLCLKHVFLKYCIRWRKICHFRWKYFYFFLELSQHLRSCNPFCQNQNKIKLLFFVPGIMLFYALFVRCERVCVKTVVNLFIFSIHLDQDLTLQFMNCKSSLSKRLKISVNCNTSIRKSQSVDARNKTNTR